MRDPLRLVLILVGWALFSAGCVLAYRDVSLDYHMGAVGVLGASTSGLGALALYMSGLVKR